MSAKRNMVAFEVEWFWLTCQRLKSINPADVTEAFDDLEVIQMHTENATLKAQCQKMLAVMAARHSGDEWRAQA